MNAGDSRGRACGHACPLLDCQPDLCRCLIAPSNAARA